MRTPFWPWALLIALSVPIDALAEPPQTHDQRPSHRPPNIVIVVGDDHAGEILGIAADPHRPTPRLDGLARQGVWFNRAFANCPLCTPSRQSFLTGRLPHAVGVTRLKTPLPDSAVTLASWLSSLGYHTAAFGKMHFNDQKAHGFAERLDTADWLRDIHDHPPKTGDHRHAWHPLVDPAPIWLNAACQPAGLPESAMESTFVADHAAEFFKRRKGTREPFFLVVGFYDPHAPFRFPDDWAHRYRREEFSVPSITKADRRDQPKIFASLTADNVRGIQAAYYTSVSFVDHSTGRIIDALDASGLAEETIVVYLGDNGYLHGQHGRFEKHCLLEPAVHVPLIVRWTGHLPAGRRVGELVELVDLFPTLLELAGLPSPTNLHGQSLVRSIRGERVGLHRAVVMSEYLENEEAMARSDRFKLIVGSGHRRREDGYASEHPPTAPYERLYDLAADPGEDVDLAGDPAFKLIQDSLRQALHARLAGSRDGLDPVPQRLGEAEAIRWCLVPRDKGAD